MKRAHQVAQAIIDDVLRHDRPIGASLGNVVGLQERYGVGRNVMREAIRLAQRDGIVESRRGVGGGLFVAARAENAVINALANYLELAEISHQEIYEAWRELEKQILVRVLKMRKAGDRTEFVHLSTGLEAEAPKNAQKIVITLGRSLEALAKCTGNPVCHLFMQPLYLVSLDYRNRIFLADGVGLNLVRRSYRLTQELMSAVIDDNPHAAHRTLSNLIANSENLVLLQRGGVPSKFDSRSRLYVGVHPEENAAENLMFRIREQIATSTLLPGESLGREEDLVSHYLVSRSVFREAVRQLEQYGIVNTQRGSGGGLLVGIPSPEAVIVQASDYLMRLSLQNKHIEGIETLISDAGQAISVGRAAAGKHVSSNNPAISLYGAIGARLREHSEI